MPRLFPGVDAPGQFDGGMEAFRLTLQQFEAKIRARISDAQSGVPTFCDFSILKAMRELNELNDLLSLQDATEQDAACRHRLIDSFELVRLVMERSQGPRFIDFQHRTRDIPGGTDIRAIRDYSDVAALDMIMSQGMTRCMEWKGMPLFKTVFDFSMYSMLLWEIKPASIFEIGSGTGASAMWLKDLTEIFGMNSTVHSVDLKKPQCVRQGVHFIEGDCRNMGAVFDPEVMHGAPHPWLLIEDAHVNVQGVLKYFHPQLLPGDYIIVEDSWGKTGEIRNFLAENPDCYMVDTLFTDFFGRNSTCAANSILLRTE